MTIELGRVRELYRYPVKSMAATARQDPLIMRTIVRMNQNHAGVYGTVVRTGTIAVGQRVRLAEAHRTGPAA